MSSYDFANAPTDPWMETASGVRFTPLHPKVEDINLLDIAHGLALQCRYGSQLKVFYSVAQHSVLVSRVVEKALQDDPGTGELTPETGALWGLLHDAPEAYIGDMIRPLKQTAELGEAYCQIEDRLMAAIAERYRLPGTTVPAIVKRADNIVLFTEKRDIKQSPLAWARESDFPPLPDRIEPWAWEVARMRFLARFSELTHSLYGPDEDSQADGFK